MPSKRIIDENILTDIKTVIAETFTIKMIELEKIQPSADNFYSMSNIDDLADDIERQGLKHNLVVFEKDGKYIIKSGHRRFAAIQKLISENRLNTKTVPCYIDTEKSEAENMLDLIALNNTARIMTDGEKIQEYQKLKEVFLQLEQEGKKPSGRMREKIADILNVSPAQVGKIENIEHNAAPEVKEAVQNGNVSISTANEIAKLDEEKQKEIINSNSKIKPREIKPNCNKKTPVTQKKEDDKQIPDDGGLSDFLEDYPKTENISNNSEPIITETETQSEENNTLSIQKEEVFYFNLSEIKVLSYCIENFLETCETDLEKAKLENISRKLHEKLFGGGKK